MRSFMIFAAHQMYWGEQIKGEVMGRPYSRCGERRNVWGDLKEGDHLEDLG